jgi:molybdenum cofactor cytidylyltransferase
MKYDCIIPAAGLSSRMFEWKLMLKYKEKTIIETVLDNTKTHVGTMIISGGYRFDELKKKVEDYDRVEMVYNKNFKKGMLTSIKAGLPYVKTEKFFIVLSDMPLIPPELFMEMSQKKFENALFPVFNGKRGHPVLIDSSLRDLILQAPDSSRMKDLLKYRDVSEYPVSSDGILFDIDTEQDYGKLLQK